MPYSWSKLKTMNLMLLNFENNSITSQAIREQPMDKHLRSYQLGNIALHSCQVGWKKGSRSPKDSNLCWCDTRLSVVCPPQMVKNQYEVFVRNKQTNKQYIYRAERENGYISICIDVIALILV